MTLEQFLSTVANKPATISFKSTIDVIAASYRYQPCGFHNGSAYSAAGQNEGSCKLLAFAQIHQLSSEQTLHCFGDFYRIDVLQHPQNTDHNNIRQLMETGIAAVRFDGTPLTPLK